MSRGGPCRFLDWDSDHFHRRIARVDLPGLTPESSQDAAAWCAEQSIDCLYLLVALDDVQSLRVAAQEGYRLVDVRVTLEHRLRTLPEPVPSRAGDLVRPYVPGDLPRLREIARTSHGGSRFYQDGGFARPDCDRLYEIWIEKSCAGEAARVLVATMDGQATGYLSCQQEESGEGKIGLVAVAPEAQGRGLGRGLVAEALRWYQARSAGRVSVVTQGANLPAQRLYQDCGFRVRSMQAWFHRWFRDSKGAIR